MKATGFTGTIDMNSLKNNIKLIAEKTVNDAEKGLDSDRRLKKNLVKVGESPAGISIYNFNYIWDSRTIYQGVIAQELLGTEYEKATIKSPETGFYSVDYDELDVEFQIVGYTTPEQQHLGA